MSNYILSNKGIKKGDIFACSWGYDQTNNDFFRVEKLRGKSQVLLKEVYLKSTCVTSHSSMSGDYIYDTKKWEYVKNSVFIKDNAAGMAATVKRQKDGSFVHCMIKGRYLLTPYHGQKVYESWYA